MIGSPNLNGYVYHYKKLKRDDQLAPRVQQIGVEQYYNKTTFPHITWRPILIAYHYTEFVVLFPDDESSLIYTDRISLKMTDVLSKSESWGGILIRIHGVEI